MTTTGRFRFAPIIVALSFLPLYGYTMAPGFFAISDAESMLASLHLTFSQAPVSALLTIVRYLAGALSGSAVVSVAHVLQVLVTLAGLAALAALAARTFASGWIAAAMVLWAGAGLETWQGASRFLGPEAWLFAGCSATVFLAYRALDPRAGGRESLLTGLMAALTVAAHPGGIMLLPIVLAVSVAFLRRGSSPARRLLGPIAGLALIAAGFAAQVFLVMRYPGAGTGPEGILGAVFGVNRIVSGEDTAPAAAFLRALADNAGVPGLGVVPLVIGPAGIWRCMAGRHYVFGGILIWSALLPLGWLAMPGAFGSSTEDFVRGAVPFTAAVWGWLAFSGMDWAVSGLTRASKAAAASTTITIAGLALMSLQGNRANVPRLLTDPWGAHVRNVFAGVPEGAALVLSDRETLAGVRFAREWLSIRTDIIVLSLDDVLNSAKVPGLARMYPALSLPSSPEELAMLRKVQSGNEINGLRRAFLIENEPRVTLCLGMDAGLAAQEYIPPNLQLVPHGLVFFVRRLSSLGASEMLPGEIEAVWRGIDIEPIIDAYKRERRFWPLAARYSTAMSLTGSYLCYRDLDEAAIVWYRKSLALLPAASTIQELGLALTGQGGNAEGEAALLQAFHLDRTLLASAERLYELASAAKDFERMQKIRDWFSAQSLPPPRGVSTQPMEDAVAALQRGDLETAERLLRQAVREDPARWAAWLELARVTEARGDLYRANGFARKARSLAPEEPSVLMFACDLALEAGLPEDAGESLRGLQSRIPGHPELSEWMLPKIQRLGDYNWSLLVAREWVEREPASSIPYFHVAQSYLLGGKPGLAQPYLEQAIQREPPLLDAYFNLAVIASQRGDLNEALLYIGQARSIDPYRPDLQRLSGEILRLKGQPADGEKR